MRQGRICFAPKAVNYWWSLQQAVGFHAESAVDGMKFSEWRWWAKNAPWAVLVVAEPLMGTN